MQQPQQGFDSQFKNQTKPSYRSDSAGQGQQQGAPGQQQQPYGAGTGSTFPGKSKTTGGQGGYNKQQNFGKTQGGQGQGQGQGQPPTSIPFNQYPPYYGAMYGAQYGVPSSAYYPASPGAYGPPGFQPRAGPYAPYAGYNQSYAHPGFNTQVGQGFDDGQSYGQDYSGGKYGAGGADPSQAGMMGVPIDSQVATTSVTSSGAATDESAGYGWWEQQAPKVDKSIPSSAPSTSTGSSTTGSSTTGVAKNGTSTAKTTSTSNPRMQPQQQFQSYQPTSQAPMGQYPFMQGQQFTSYDAQFQHAGPAQAYQAPDQRGYQQQQGWPQPQ